MKIALCLYGHLRTYESCYESLRKNLIDLYDCDVFMHTWDTLEANTKSWHDSKIKENRIINEKNIIVEKYKLKNIKIEKQDNREQEFGYYHPVNFPERNASIWGVHCYWHSLEEVNKLRIAYENTNEVQYDFVIFTRPDILFNDKFDIQKHLKDLDQSKINNSFFCFADPLLGKSNPRVNDDMYLAGCDLFFFACPRIINDIIKNHTYILNKIKKDEVIKRTVESLILELVQYLGYQFWVASFIGLGYNPISVIREQNPKTQEILKRETYLEKHQKALTNAVKSAVKIPSELLSVIFYTILKK